MGFRIRAAAAAFVLGKLACASAVAALIVNPAQPLTRQVTVQLIQTALDNGTLPATVFGDANQTAEIEAGIDTIWAQAGINIKFLPTLMRYNNTFAYQGTAGSGVRSQGDLNTIVANARAAGILNPNPLVLNLIFVGIVPAFTPLNGNTSAGLSFIAANGSADYVGATLLTFDSGHDVISSVMAHELGHNLGLNHTANGTANLMSPSGTSQQLNSDQIAIARASTFAQAFTTSLAGDYNGNGVVDSADYVVWRNTLNQSGTGLPADGNANGRIDAGDYTAWRSDFAGRAGGAGADISLQPALAGVPEPSTLSCFAILFALLVVSIRSNRA